MSLANIVVKTSDLGKRKAWLMGYIEKNSETHAIIVFKNNSDRSFKTFPLTEIFLDTEIPVDNIKTVSTVRDINLKLVGKTK